ncbi:helix-turn-helix transcriptional regulator [Bacillus sp. FSL W7-1294]|uniref:helix-turn-helix domain-containing protein n=1 Tax=Bacillus TaxID=1386 RepID=UPI0009B2F200|nr:helix-turn-helix transcriptional regulator [Bacillus cereus]
MNQNKWFADFIKNKRKEKQLTTSQLAELSGLSQSYISNLENGNRKTPKIETINKLAKGLGVPNGTLMMAAGLVNDPFDTVTDNQVIISEIKLPAVTEYTDNDGLSTTIATQPNYLFDLFYLLNMNVDLHYKDKLLTDNDKNKIKIMLQTIFE